jgi:hypothetical protein
MDGRGYALDEWPLRLAVSQNHWFDLFQHGRAGYMKDEPREEPSLTRSSAPLE